MVSLMVDSMVDDVSAYWVERVVHTRGGLGTSKLIANEVVSRACRGVVTAVAWLAGSWVHRTVSWMACFSTEEMLAPQIDSRAV